jgi:hypothetical protein
MMLVHTPNGVPTCCSWPFHDVGETTYGSFGARRRLVVLCNLVDAVDLGLNADVATCNDRNLY